MKWFYKFLMKRLKETDQEQYCVNSPVRDEYSNKLGVATARPLDMPGINFTLFPAHGGHVIEIRQYDKKTDRNEVSLHIIRSDEDVGEAIGKIITYEALQR